MKIRKDSLATTMKDAAEVAFRVIADHDVNNHATGFEADYVCGSPSHLN